MPLPYQHYLAAVGLGFVHIYIADHPRDSAISLSQYLSPELSRNCGEVGIRNHLATEEMRSSHEGQIWPS